MSYEAAFHEHRRYLWHVLYRLTGCAADTDDLVQETFVRAMEKPPADMERTLRPWLVRVGMNLGRDLLRRRRRATYAGPWLPSPVPTEPASSTPLAQPATGFGGVEALPSYEPGDAALVSTEGRYDLLESVTFAFLLALEALTPKQRAVLLLRDVFDYSVRETAWALDISEPNVKTTLHRARRAMAAYDAERIERGADSSARVRETLERFIALFTAGDTRGIESMLAADVRALSDGGGEYVAALNPILGPDHVARFAVGVRPPLAAIVDARVVECNGLPVVDLRITPPKRRVAPHAVIGCDLDRSGKIRRVYAVLATRKLTALARAA